MKNLKDFISEKKQYIVKVPKNIYTTGTMKAKELVDKFNNEFDFESSSLFEGLMDKNFDYIYCNGNSEGYQDANDAVHTLFPSDSLYYDYTDTAEICKDFEENGLLLRFKTKDNKHVCVIDDGDNGISYVCIEK